MKYFEDTPLEALPGRYLKADALFRFRCHPGIGCFNRCCRNLNLFLHPYDVLRLRKALNIPSDAFLERYVDVVLREGEYFPDVLLKMAEDREKSCVFLSSSGCSVYAHRPHTCRLYPLEQGVSFDGAAPKGRLVHFFRPFDFCQGPSEGTSWTPESWFEDQGALPYNAVTLPWSELRRLFRRNPWGTSGLSGPKGKMAFMATYNLDRFRDFVFNSSFLKRYFIEPALGDQIRNEDTPLLKFGFEWVKFIVWQIPSPLFRQVSG